MAGSGVQRRQLLHACLGAGALFLPRALRAQKMVPHAPLERLLPPDRLLRALRRGGLVVLMRHAASPHDPPAAEMAEPDNPARERQLDARGRADAIGFGQGLRARDVRFATLYCSPAYRARSTARLAGLTPELRPFLDHNASPGHPAPQADEEALRALIAQPLGRRENRLILTHWPNIVALFPKAAAGMDEGDMLLIRPAADGLFAHVRLVGALAIGDWPAPATGIEAAEDACARAVIDRDGPALERLLADDLSYVHANGARQGKAGYIADALADRWSIRGMTFPDRAVQVQNRNAFVQGVVAFDVDGTIRKARYLAIYRREGRDWRLLRWQNTALRD